MSFEEIGYRRFSGLLEESLISEANQALRVILDSLNPESELWPHVVPLSDLGAGRNPEIESAGFNGIPFILGELPQFSEFFRDFILQPELWQAAEEILQSSSVIIISRISPASLPVLGRIFHGIVIIRTSTSARKTPLIFSGHSFLWAQ